MPALRFQSVGTQIHVYSHGRIRMKRSSYKVRVRIVRLRSSSKKAPPKSLFNNCHPTALKLNHTCLLLSSAIATALASFAIDGARSVAADPARRFRGATHQLRRCFACHSNKQQHHSAAGSTDRPRICTDSTIGAVASSIERAAQRAQHQQPERATELAQRATTTDPGYQEAGERARVGAHDVQGEAATGAG